MILLTEILGSVCIVFCLFLAAVFAGIRLGESLSARKARLRPIPQSIVTVAGSDVVNIYVSDERLTCYFTNGESATWSTGAGQKMNSFKKEFGVTHAEFQEVA
jgi:hypothetical protein